MGVGRTEADEGGFDSLGLGAPERLVFLRQIRRRQRTTGSSSSSSSSDGSAGSHFLAGGKAGSVGSLAYFAFNFHGRNAQVTGDCPLFISFSLVCFLIFFFF